jgi:hypothetical protein
MASAGGGRGEHCPDKAAVVKKLNEGKKYI